MKALSLLLCSIDRVKPRGSDNEEYTVMKTVCITTLAPYSDTRERVCLRQHYRQSVRRNEQSANDIPARLTGEAVLRISPTIVVYNHHESGKRDTRSPYCDQSQRDEEVESDAVAEVQWFG